MRKACRRMGVMFVASLLVNGCGPPSEPRGGEKRAQLFVQLVLPKALQRGTSGYDRLSARASHILFRLKSKEGFESERTFPVQQWKDLRLDEIDFPRANSDSLEITAEVWLRESDGLGIGVPGLRGQGRVKDEDLSPEGTGRIEVKLRPLEPISKLRGGSDPVR